MDVSKPDMLQSFFEGAGRNVDVLVNSAGSMGTQALVKLTTAGMPRDLCTIRLSMRFAYTLVVLPILVVLRHPSGRQAHTDVAVQASLKLPVLPNLR